jgi:hypothetical protein
LAAFSGAYKMRKIFAVLMVLVLGGSVFAALAIDTSCTTPTVTVCMRSDTTGLPTAALTPTNFSCKYTLSTGLLSAALTGEVVAANVSWATWAAADDGGGLVGVCEEITNASTGVGTYRIYLPLAFVTSPVSGQCRTVSVIDATGVARAIQQVQFTPPSDVKLTNGTTTPSITVADGHVEANVVVMANDVITASALAADAATEIAAAVNQDVSISAISAFGTCTTGTIVLADDDFGVLYDPVYCPIIIVDATDGKTYTRICIGYANRTLTIFPSLPITPVTGDTVYMRRTFGGFYMPMWNKIQTLR